MDSFRKHLELSRILYPRIVQVLLKAATPNLLTHKQFPGFSLDVPVSARNRWFLIVQRHLNTNSRARPSSSFLSHHTGDLESQGIQSDKAFGVFLVVNLILFKGREIGIVQGSLGLSPDDDAVPLVEPQPDMA